MLIIPLAPTASQSELVTLNGQNAQVNVYQKWTGLFLDLYVSNVLIIAGVLGRDRRLMLMNTYLGFAGDLMWLDNHGLTDPQYTGLGPDGSRYSLLYLLPSEVPPLGFNV